LTPLKDGSRNHLIAATQQLHQAQEVITITRTKGKLFHKRNNMPIISGMQQKRNNMKGKLIETCDVI
jgi:hypothetical protein